jgi:hypothetical protein
VYLYTHITGVFFLPTINVPGIGEVFADGFAEEQTMNRILAVLQSSDNANSPEAQQRLAAAANASSSSVSMFGKRIQESGNLTKDGSASVVQGFRDATDASFKYGRTMRQATSGVIRSFDSLQSKPFALAQSLTTMIGTIADSTGFLGKAVLGIAGGFAGAEFAKAVQDSFGSKLAGALTGGLLGAFAPQVLTAIAGFIFEKLNSTSDAFKKVQQSGALLGGSLVEFRVNAHASNLTMAEFSNVFQKAGEEMATFGGQTLRGAREFARANRELNKNATELRMLGFSFEDLGLATADMMSKFAMSGVAIDESAISTREFSEATRTQLLQQKTIATLTGRSIERQKEAERQQRKDVQVQAAIARLGPQQQLEIERLISAFPQMRGAILDTVTFNGLASKDALMLSSAMPTLTEGIINTVRDIKGGSGVAVDAFKDFAKNNTTIRSEFLNNADLVAAVGRFTDNTFVKTIEGSLLSLQKTMAVSINRTIEDVADDYDRIRTGQNAATKALIELENKNRDLGMTMSALTTGLLKNSKGIVAFLGSATEKLNDGINGLAGMANIRGSTSAGPYNSEVSALQGIDGIATAMANTGQGINNASSNIPPNNQLGGGTTSQTKTVDVNAPVLQRQIEELTKVMRGTNNKMDSLSTVLT